MYRQLGKAVIVTGASAGIGGATVQALVRQGFKVVGLARRLHKMQELNNSLKNMPGKLYPVQCDVSKEADILKAFEWTEKQLGGVDVLVNNAGVVTPENIIDGKTEDYRKIIDVNVIAAAICARETVRSIKKRNAKGHIIFVNSITGHYANSVTVPISIYAASKYAITGMCETIRNEVSLAKIPIKITSISPGAADTALIVGVLDRDETFKKLPLLRSEDVANSILDALMTPDHVEIRELIITPTPTFA